MLQLLPTSRFKSPKPKMKLLNEPRLVSLKMSMPRSIYITLALDRNPDAK